LKRALILSRPSHGVKSDRLLGIRLDLSLKGEGCGETLLN
jgi:hypothetical protein